MNYAKKQKGHKLKLGGKRALHHKITSAELGMEIFFCIPNANCGVCIPSHILILDPFTYNKIGRFLKNIIKSGLNIKTCDGIQTL
jgi:hypothetical protein